MTVQRYTGSDCYYFSDFTRENYRHILRLAQKRFTFRTYDDYIEKESFVIWRHDVDTSLNSAYKLAIIEAEEGIVAYYFIHLHNVFYNPLELKMSNLVREILSYGHRIGLHFDSNYYNIRNELELERWLSFEADILARIFDIEITTFSFHNPTDITTAFSNAKYAGLLNTSSDYFRTDVEYCSDSNGYWRHRRLEDVLKEDDHDRIQVLTHPEWWQESVMSPKERIWRSIEGRAASTKQWYEDMLILFGRDNVDGVL
jgi:hypothetical protein